MMLDCSVMIPFLLIWFMSLKCCHEFMVNEFVWYSGFFFVAAVGVTCCSFDVVLVR